MRFALKLASAALCMVASVAAAPEAVGFGPGCILDLAPLCSEPDPFSGGRIYARCCKSDDYPTVPASNNNYASYADPPHPVLWLLGYSQWQGKMSDPKLDPEIKAAWDRGCKDQHGVASYGHVHPWVFQAVCIAGKGTDSEHDVTGEVANAVHFDVVLPSQRSKDAKNKVPTVPKTGTPHKKTYGDYHKVKAGKGGKDAWVVKCKELVYLLPANGFAVDFVYIKGTNLAHVCCWRFNKDGSKTDVVTFTARALGWTILDDPKGSSGDDASKKHVKNPNSSYQFTSLPELI